MSADVPAAGAPEAAPRAILPLLLAAYAAFYLCRANVEPGLNLLAIEHGYDNEQIGLVMAIALGGYAVGKLVLSPIADVRGGKQLLVASLFATVAVSFAIAALDGPRRFGPALGLVLTGALVVANRFVQAGGWGGLVHVVGVTYGAERRGTIMGILSTSYDVGNVLALLLSAAIVQAGLGWRALFVVNPAIVLVVAIVVWKFLAFSSGALPRSPDPVRHSALARVERGAPPLGRSASSRDGWRGRASVFARPVGQGGFGGKAPEEKDPLGGIVKRLARQPSFWFATALSFLLTFVRAGFMTWTPRFLYEVSVAAHASSPTSGSIAKSAFFGVAGIIGSVVTGRLSDRLGPGRRAPLMTVSLGILVGCVLALAHAGVRAPLVAALGVAACGLFLLGPYSLLAGAVSLDVAGRRGAATAAGFIDAVGYVGASLSALVLGSVSKRAGWTAAFDVVAAVTFLAFVLALVWSLRRASPSLSEPPVATNM